VLVLLTVRRFFCPNPACLRRLFAERFPPLVEPFARKTTRLLAAWRAIGWTAGGTPGARLTRHLALPTSPTTLLRCVNTLPYPPIETVRVVGVDDWAWKKGQRYGTILVDLERHRVVDLLVERSSESFAAWLRAHPGVEIISRDRGSVYSEGATLGAPHAQQIADRWHLLSNLRDALEQLLDRHRSALQVVREPGAAPGSLALASANKPALLRRRLISYARYEQTLVLHERGLSNSEIARQVGVTVRTITRYLTTNQRPRKRRSRLEPYLPALRQRWEEGCHNASQLWRELRAQGFNGTFGLVNNYVWCLRHPDLLEHPEAVQVTRQTFAPRKAVWFFLRWPEDLRDDDRANLAAILQACPEAALVYPLAQSFRRLIASGKPTGFLSWLEEASASVVPELRRFAHGLNLDLDAVVADFRFHWSNRHGNWCGSSRRKEK
jgi:transposase